MTCLSFGVRYDLLVAMSQVLLKIHSRCNLSCTYCYVYTSPDDSWRTKPRRMSLDNVKLVAQRMREHASRHAMRGFTVILHGGEPLLAGVDFIDTLAGELRAGVPPEVRLNLFVQTNGLLLDEDFLRIFERHSIKVGVSLDGGIAANDRHRLFPDGRGSYDGVARALRSLAARPAIYSGILATVDLANDPVQTYTSLLEFSPPRLDFLLPHGTWDNPPPGRKPDTQDAPYADWLIKIFDLWLDSRPPPTRLRLFESAMSLLLGGGSFTEVLGLHPIDLVTVESDGSYEQGDVLKIVGRGAAATGLHLATHDFDAVMDSPGIRARRLGLAGLGPQCQRCELVGVCGGGHYAHRFRGGTFLNPSVYCADMTKLIRHVRLRMLAGLGVQGQVASG